MRPALLLPAAALLALTGCAGSTASTPTETVTVTVTPSATPSPTGPSEDELQAWADEIETGMVEHYGTWQEQCNKADFKVAECFIEDIDVDGYKQLTVTMDLTEDQVPGLEIPFEKYRDNLAEDATLTINRAIREDHLAVPYPEQIRVYDAATEKMIGFSDTDNGWRMEWFGDS